MNAAEKENGPERSVPEGDSGGQAEVAQPLLQPDVHMRVPPPTAGCTPYCIGKAGGVILHRGDCPNLHHRDLVPQGLIGGVPLYKEAVNHPQHYGGDTPHEVIKCLAAWGLETDALLWNTVKYIARAGRKGPALEDLRKAAWYLNRRIEQLERL